METGSGLRPDWRKAFGRAAAARRSFSSSLPGAAVCSVFLRSSAASFFSRRSAASLFSSLLTLPFCALPVCEISASGTSSAAIDSIIHLVRVLILVRGAVVEPDFMFNPPSRARKAHDSLRGQGLTESAAHKGGEWRARADGCRLRGTCRACAELPG